MSKLLAEFREESAYLDTMLPYAFLRGIEPGIKPFFRQIESGDIQAYTSILTFDELAYRLILALIKDSYPGSPLENLRNNEFKYLSEFTQPVVTQLEQLQNFPNLIVLDIRSADLELIYSAMVQYRLRPRDALHYAAMLWIGCFNLVSNDSHFDRIPEIQRFSF